MCALLLHKSLHCARVLAIAGILSFTSGHAVTAPVLGYQVVARYPHSTASYTEGFFYLNGLFYRVAD